MFKKTYHKDSYMAHRRGETLGQEGKYRRTPGSPTTTTAAAVPQSAAGNRRRSDVLEVSSDATVANLSIGSTVWETQHRDLSASSSSVLFTSDALKRIRRGERASQLNLSAAGANSAGAPVRQRQSSPPQVAPKPAHGRLIVQQQQQQLQQLQQLAASTSDISSSTTTPAAAGRYYSPSSLHAAKSVPALNVVHHEEEEEEDDEGKKRTRDGAETEDWLEEEGLDKTTELKRDVGRSGPTRTTSSSSSSSSSARPHQPATKSHVHGSSDSGLSSLSGRTSTMSPLSTLSTVSSGSAGSNGAHAAGAGGQSSAGGGGGHLSGSSRASLRSSSIVSSGSSVAQIEAAAASATSSSGSSAGDSGTGTLLRQEEEEEEDVKLVLNGGGVAGDGKAGGGVAPSSVCVTKFREEIECEELGRQIFEGGVAGAGQPPSGGGGGVADDEHRSRMQELFVPSPLQKTLADYVEGVLEVDLEGGRGQPQRKVKSQRSTASNGGCCKKLSPNLLRRKIEELKLSEGTERLSHQLLPPPADFNDTSSRGPNDGDEMSSHARLNNHRGHRLSPPSSKILLEGEELRKKKDELLDRICHKLDVLRAEQLSLKEEVAINEELGLKISAIVHRRAKPNECVKFNLHVEEIEKITSLLLGLSARLARTENSLAAMQQSKRMDTDERKMLENKREKLSSQLDEAKRLKECLDRRSAAVSAFLRRYLDADQYDDYDHFVKMKAKLIMDSREIGDKVALGEEQVRALREDAAAASAAASAASRGKAGKA